MAAFRVGEIVILQNCVRHTWANGEEAEIVRGLCTFYGRTSGQWRTGYVVRMRNGGEYGVEPHQLRRRPPKSNDTEWAQSKVRDLLKVNPEEVAA